MNNQMADHDPLYPIKVGYEEKTRMLMFHSTPIEFNRLEEALNLIGGYNLFDPKAVFKTLSVAFGEGYEYIIGREYSVVIYVEPKRSKGFYRIDTWLEGLVKELKVDEVSIEDNKLRLWWD